MDAVSGATERPWPHRIRIVSYGYEDIYKVEVHRMPRYARVLYHQKWARTLLGCQSITEINTSYVAKYQF
jgi:hypothetical protein